MMWTDGRCVRCVIARLVVKSWKTLVLRSVGLMWPMPSRVDRQIWIGGDFQNLYFGRGAGSPSFHYTNQFFLPPFYLVFTGYVLGYLNYSFDSLRFAN